MRRIISTIAASTLILTSAVGLAIAQGLENPIQRNIPQGAIQIALKPVAGGMTAPNWGTPSPVHPGRLFVVDQDGILWAVNLATGGKRVFLDLSALLVELGAFGPGSFDERGFLGVAFHPDYANNGLLYTYTSEPARGPGDFSTMPPGTTADHHSVIRQWRVPFPRDRACVVNPDSSRPLMKIAEPQFNHNAGAINFGPDGMLYIALGDGGNADDEGDGHSPQGNGQDTTNLLGDIIRIDPLGSNSANGRYGIPADNPFLGKAGFLPEIYAYGFRNPFRFSFDKASGRLWVADVGQNDIEEVNIVNKGGNYGWRIKEGTFLFDANGVGDGFVTARSPGSPPGLRDPIAEYDHDDGIAVIGGFVYRGKNVPALAGLYVFAENIGRVFYLGRDKKIFEALDGPIDAAVLGTGQDAAGELYVMVNATGVPFGNTGRV
ncbi:MAG TPA: PQQ-dependent sugar dehydrogenase, partial [Lysobacter sp.]|nr:PQQ-dependent sugar dehydrogenase [Lysobacter sp.]